MADVLGISIWVVFLFIGLVSVVFFWGRWVGHVNSERREFHEFMDEMREDIKEILSRLPDNPDLQESPMPLNKRGTEIIG